MNTLTTMTTPQPPAEAPSLGIDDLRQLMRSFNEATERLQETHMALQRDVVRLKGELTEANAQLHRSRSLAAMGEMAAGIAHEVRNPLASIGLYAQMLVEDLVDRPEGAMLARRITDAVQRIDTIVRDVLRFARDSTVHPQRVRAALLIDEAIESCRTALAEADVTVINNYRDAQPLELEVDTTLMVQALANIICNAAEAVAENCHGERTVSITLGSQRRRLPRGGRAERIVLGVHDSGPGIPPEVLERMFNPFFTTRRTGTGLGLAIVHRLVEAHGGPVAVSNRIEGGAMVELCLPPLAARSTQ